MRCVQPARSCGAAFATKPNIGLAAFAAVVATLITQRYLPRPGRRRRNAIGWSATGFFVTVAGMMLPFVVTHTTGALLGDVFTGKGTAYLQVEGRSVLPGFGQSFRLLTDAGSSFGQDVTRTVHLVPCVALVLLVVSGWRLRRNRTPGIVATVAFAVVGFAVAAPDFAPQHLTEAMPLLLGLAIIGARRAAVSRHSRPPGGTVRWRERPPWHWCSGSGAPPRGPNDPQSSDRIESSPKAFRRCRGRSPPTRPRAGSGRHGGAPPRHGRNRLPHVLRRELLLPRRPPPRPNRVRLSRTL